MELDSSENVIDYTGLEPNFFLNIKDNFALRHSYISRGNLITIFLALHT